MKPEHQFILAMVAVFVSCIVIFIIDHIRICY
jgi:hypothetical protein